MEIMVVVIITGTLAALALTTYTKTVNRARVENAIRQLTLIHGANQVYRARNGKLWPNISGSYPLIDINANLHLNLSNDDFNFSCFNGNGTVWTCTATKGSLDPTVTVTEAPISATNPRCTTYCP